MNINNNRNVFDISVLELNVAKTLAYEVIQEYAKGNAPAYQRTSKDDEVAVQIDSIVNCVYDLAVKRALIDKVQGVTWRKYTTSSYELLAKWFGS
ncbi:MAG: hypothetical protein FWC92_07210 [Defluviitaleaceae bacterium]|nr:hypothetical protein [Defluviitaleaceae bacterium]